MKFRVTKHQVARGSRPDAESGEKLYLLKNVSELRATYQIRLLTFRATQEGRHLIIRVPKHCVVSTDLAGLLKDNRKSVKLERV